MRKMLLAGLLLGTNLSALAQTDMPKPAYDFSLPREERIKLAESAAPPEISGKATVYVLERTGYVKVREGTNGFSCFVDRQNPLNLEPTCFDAEGSATTLLSRLYAEEQRAQPFFGLFLRAALNNRSRLAPHRDDRRHIRKLAFAGPRDRISRAQETSHDSATPPGRHRA